MKDVFTVGEVAHRCQVASRTAAKWIDEGLLKGYRIPGSRFRRVPRESLVRFMREHDIPLGDLAPASVSRVVVFSSDDEVRSGLLQRLNGDGFTCVDLPGGYARPPESHRVDPDAFVIDYAAWPETCETLRDLLRGCFGPGAVFVGLLAAGDDGGAVDPGRWAELFRRPFDVDLLAERVRTLVAKKKADY
ncbi:MAG: helix-turn-helix domain-containing protein [Planctomycetota bacterium]